MKTDASTEDTPPKPATATANDNSTALMAAPPFGGSQVLSLLHKAASIRPAGVWGRMVGVWIDWGEGEGIL